MSSSSWQALLAQFFRSPDMTHVRDVTQDHFDRFFYGVRSMAPMGAWLPWSEVIALARPFGFSEHHCQLCAEFWRSVDALEVDPPCSDVAAVDSKHGIARVRLAFHPDIMGEDGLALVSSDEELPVQEIAVTSDEDMPVATGAPSTLRRWASGVLRPVAGVKVDMPLPQDVDVHDASMLMVYWHLFCQYHHHQQLRSHVLAVDIPDWARTLLV